MQGCVPLGGTSAQKYFQDKQRKMSPGGGRSRWQRSSPRYFGAGTRRSAGRGGKLAFVNSFFSKGNFEGCVLGGLSAASCLLPSASIRGAWGGERGKKGRGKIGKWGKGE